MEDLAERLGKHKVYNIRRYSFIHGASHLITQDKKVGLMSFAFYKVILAVANHCLVLSVPGNGFQEDLLRYLPNTGQLVLLWIFPG